MPRRLLNVGSIETNVEPFLFEPFEPVQYVCLSYCWGPDVQDVLKTTKENLKSHYAEVPFVSMPATIQDAVTVCRRLGICYLWVDSLCIVQNDRGSWFQDSAQMREIYSNSHLTISAEEPESCKLGFLGPQKKGKPEWQRRFETDVPLEAGGPRNELFIRPNSLLEGTLNRDRDNPDNKLPEEKRCSLDKRGWCLQESILPNRRLCFNGDEMMWKCSHRNICECGHSLWEQPKTRNRRGRDKGQYSDKDEDAQYARPKSYEDWRFLVEEFSDRSLTQQLDKLSALSGMAKMFAAVQENQNATGTYELYRGTEKPRVEEFQPPPQKPKMASNNIYLAGLWQDEFVFDLTWYAVSSETDAESSQQFCAPTWSVSTESPSHPFPYALHLP